MHLHEYLTQVAATYDRSAPMSAPAQMLLQAANEHLDGYAPGGFWIIGSGGKGRPTFTPWVGFFDPDETITPQHGLYVVYLFSFDTGTVSLLLNQGITELSNQLGASAARHRLARDANVLRQASGSALPSLRWDWSRGA